VNDITSPHPLPTNPPYMYEICQKAELLKHLDEDLTGQTNMAYDDNTQKTATVRDALRGWCPQTT